MAAEHAILQPIGFPKKQVSVYKYLETIEIEAKIEIWTLTVRNHNALGPGMFQRHALHSPPPLSGPSLWGR